MTSAPQLLHQLHLERRFHTAFLATRETHISLLFIGRERTVKFKKALRFPFIDHSTLSQRWHSCRSEVLLNRRLAPTLYIGVVAIFSDREELFSDAIPEEPPSDCSECAVLMHTFSEDHTLAQMLNNAGVEQTLPKLAEVLAAFHKRSLVRDETYPTHFSHWYSENIEAICSASKNLPQQMVDQYELHGRRLLDALAPFLSGRPVVDGHGDLRAEHVILEGGTPQVFDCVEFSKELRLVDPLDDLSFLLTDLVSRERADLQGPLEQSYFQHFPEARCEMLEQLYRFHRLSVRCKVSLLSDQQEMAKRYLGLALRCAYRLRRPFVLAVCGLSGTGKSTVAKQLSEFFSAPLLQTDQVRQEIMPAEKERYSIAARENVYEELFHRVPDIVQKHELAVLDGTFQRQELRNKLIQRVAVPVLFCGCSVDEDERLRRVQNRRGDLSEVDRAVAETQSFDPFTNEAFIEIDTGRSDFFAQLLQKLEKRASSGR